MNTILIILTILALGTAFYMYSLYTGKVKDVDGDFIPDVVEDKVEEVTTEVKRRTKRVKQELKDVKEAGVNLAKQTKDVVDAAKGKPRRGRKLASKKPATK